MDMQAILKLKEEMADLVKKIKSVEKTLDLLEARARSFGFDTDKPFPAAGRPDFLSEIELHRERLQYLRHARDGLFKQARTSWTKSTNEQPEVRG